MNQPKRNTLLARRISGLAARYPAFRLLLLSSAIPYGGQAAIEGVMMKGREHAALAVRRSDGRIEVIEREAKSRWPRLSATPFVRGVAILIDMFGLGSWALRESARRFEIDAQNADDEKKRAKSADLQGDAATVATTPVPALNTQAGEEKQGAAQTITMVISVIIALLVFKVLPVAASSGIWHLIVKAGWEGAGSAYGHAAVVDIIEGVIKFTIFVGYVWSVGRLAEIRRVFEYHGAEHIVINAYEDDEHNQEMRFIQSHGVAHPRCGTSFIAILILMSIVLFTLLDWWLIAAHAPLHEDIPIWYFRWPLRIVGLLPLAGISYEIIRAAFKYYANPLLRPLLRFGMLFQVLTVRRPSDDQVEVSLASFNRVRFLTEGIVEPITEQVREAEAAGAFVA
jgi:uncharacterized protein YqhQ